MHNYELMFIVHPDLDEIAFNETVNRVSGWITDSGGEVMKTEILGKRRLAYAIRKQREGQYVLFNVKMARAAVAELERNLRFLEPVLRFLLVAR